MVVPITVVLALTPPTRVSDLDRHRRRGVARAGGLYVAAGCWSRRVQATRFSSS